MVICLERVADLHVAQLMPLPLTVSCFSKIQIGFTFMVPAHPGSPGKRAVKRMCVCVCSRGAGSMKRSRIRLSVCPIRLPHAPASGLLLWAQLPGDIDRLLHGWRAGGHQQPQCSMACSSNCGQCRVVS